MVMLTKEILKLCHIRFRDMVDIACSVTATGIGNGVGSCDKQPQLLINSILFHCIMEDINVTT